MHPSRYPFGELLEDCPVIAAVKSEEGLQQSLQSDSGIIFILHGDLCGIREIVRRVHDAGKTAMVHTDLIGGLSGKDVCAVDYLRNETGADGIISTKPSMVRHAGEIGMYSGFSSGFHGVRKYFQTEPAGTPGLHRGSSRTDAKGDLPDCRTGTDTGYRGRAGVRQGGYHECAAGGCGVGVHNKGRTVVRLKREIDSFCKPMIFSGQEKRIL